MKSKKAIIMVFAVTATSCAAINGFFQVLFQIKTYAWVVSSFSTLSPTL